MNKLNVANTILQQLGGNKFQVMTGAKLFVATKRGLQFRLGKNKMKSNCIQIDLDQATDSYTMRFIKIRKYEPTTLKEINLLDASQLQEVFTSYTGLDTHL